MNRLRDSGANQMHYPQKIVAIADAKFAALIAIPNHPRKSFPFSNAVFAECQHIQLKNKLSRTPIYITAIKNINNATTGCPNNKAIMASIVP